MSAGFKRIKPDKAVWLGLKHISSVPMITPWPTRNFKLNVRNMTLQLQSIWMEGGLNYASHARQPKWCDGHGGPEPGVTVEGSGYMPLFCRHCFPWEHSQVNCESHFLCQKCRALNRLKAAPPCDSSPAEASVLSNGGTSWRNKQNEFIYFCQLCSTPGWNAFIFFNIFLFRSLWWWCQSQVAKPWSTRCFTFWKTDVSCFGNRSGDAMISCWHQDSKTDTKSQIGFCNQRGWTIGQI